MGLFSPRSSDPHRAEPELTRTEAFLGILLGAAGCDGVVSDAERQAIFTITERTRLFENISPHRWAALANDLIDLLAHDGLARFTIRCAEAIPDHLRDCIFANACDIVLADGQVEPEEKRFLDHLQHELHLDSRQALNIVEVLIAKNKA